MAVPLDPADHSVIGGAHHILADVTIALHAVFVLFVIVGQVLILAGWLRGWGWTRWRLFRLLHLGSIGFVVLEAWLKNPACTSGDSSTRAEKGPFIFACSPP